MAINLNNQRVLVIGAAGGIGEATARAFAGDGANVTAAGRASEILDAVAQSIGATAVALDFLDNDAVEGFFASHDAFDHVVIAAAATMTGPVAKLAMPGRRWRASSGAPTVLRAQPASTTAAR